MNQPFIPREHLPSEEVIRGCHVLVAGDAILDRYWLGSVDRVSREAPVPIVEVEREEERLGGAANAAINLRSLGAKVTLASIRSTDGADHSLSSLLDDAGICWAGAVDPSLPTTIKLRIVGRAQQLLRADFIRGLPTSTALDAFGEAFAQTLPDCVAVLLSDYGRGTLNRISALIDQARAFSLPVVIDPRAGDFTRYAGATLLTPNRSELREAIGPWRDEDDLAKRAQAMRERLGIEALLLTRSEEGMTLFDHQGALHVPATARAVYDVTGAGDTVAAVMALLLGCGVPIRMAVPYANRAGGIVVERFGTATVTQQELFT